MSYPVDLRLFRRPQGAERDHFRELGIPAESLINQDDRRKAA
jgi:hypothetical protein